MPDLSRPMLLSDSPQVQAYFELLGLDVWDEAQLHRDQYHDYNFLEDCVLKVILPLEVLQQKPPG